MKLLIFIVIWVIGSIMALLGERRLREYKQYDNSTTYLIIGITLCLFTSWLMVFGALVNGTFEFPKKKRVKPLTD